MELPINPFKQALRDGIPQFGLWVALADAYVAEVLATTGYDWLLLDGEHAPNDLRSLLAQLQAVAPYPVHPIVRPPVGDTALIKQLLDIGVQTLLIPMVESAEAATRLVAAARYPPRGVRGVGSALARSSRWSQIDAYLHRSDEQICVLVQVESVAAMAQVEAIAAVEGVDGVFFGPADLSASMGLLGQPDHPEVRRVIANGIEVVRAAGKAPGILATDRSLAMQYVGLGALFVAVGVDTALLVQAAQAQLAPFRADELPTPAATARS